MMKWIFSGMIILSIVTGVMNSRMYDVSQAAMSGAGEAVQLVISLLGMMCDTVTICNFFFGKHILCTARTVCFNLNRNVKAVAGFLE